MRFQWSALPIERLSAGSSSFSRFITQLVRDEDEIMNVWAAVKLYQRQSLELIVGSLALLFWRAPEVKVYKPG